MIEIYQFPDIAANADRLDSEIRAEAALDPILDGVTVSSGFSPEDTFTNVLMTAVLTGPQYETLSGIVEAHIPTPLPQAPPPDFYSNSFAVVDLSPVRTIANLFQDGLATVPINTMPTRNVRLYPYFAIMAQHGHASQPSEWVVLLHKDGPPVASGFFKWNANSFTNANTWRPWMIDNSEVLMEENPIGETISAFGLTVHNNGSGTAIDGIAVRVALGWTVVT